jgi:hypothetical protein
VGEEEEMGCAIAGLRLITDSMGVDFKVIAPLALSKDYDDL